MIRKTPLAFILALALALPAAVLGQDSVALSQHLGLSDAGNVVLVIGTVRDVEEEQVHRQGIESEFEMYSVSLILSVGDPKTGRELTLDCLERRDDCFALEVGDIVFVTAEMRGWPEINSGFSVRDLSVIGKQAQ